MIQEYNLLVSVLERPFLVLKTKCDIRQWFLVSDWNPLTVWFYRDCYVRFCSQEYTMHDFNPLVPFPSPSNTSPALQSYFMSSFFILFLV